MSRDITDLNAFRERRLAHKDTELDTLRNEYLEQILDLLDDYLDEVGEMVRDPEKEIEELVAVTATMLAVAAEEHIEEDGREELIDTIAEIAIELLEEDDSQGRLFDDDV